MTRRFFASLAVAGIFVVVALLVPGFVAGQAPTAPAKPKVPAKAWTLSHTPDGQPDLQGYWTNTTYTPLQRPNNINREFFTKEELEERVKHSADDESAQTTPGTIADVHYDFTQFGLDRSQGVLALNMRTSMIVDPPDGRLPPLSEEGKSRTAERAAERKRMGAATDMVQNQPLSVRCMHMDRDGPPMLPGAYNNTYQIIQSPGYLTILVEMLHWVRVIPLDNRAHLPSNVRQWVGSHTGRWEGNTLVIDSTNFTNKTVFQGASEKMHMIERLTRTDEDTIRYQFTVDDPSTWTKPWTAELYFKKTVGPIFEHACHEGNYGLANTLSGARAEEKRTAARKP